MPKGEGSGGMKSIYLPKRYLVYAENNIVSLAEWVKGKMDEDMADDISLLDQRIKDIDFEKSQLKEKIKMVKEREKIAKQKLKELIEKAQGKRGGVLKSWAEGWRSEILGCGETVESFMKIVEGKKIKV